MAATSPDSDGEPVTTPALSASSGTRGFLFSDLRGYTAFVERAGDQAAAELLATYRALVRDVIAAHDGAEIKTEGDSVYVVFPQASTAVEAGLEIIAAAAEHSTAEVPIRVGVGVHAGETVATTEGLVGGAVNIAARVCAKARSGEVLVTDTVRALTRTFLPYRYTSLGTQQLKGIVGGIPLYRVELTPTTTSARLRRQLSARRGRVALVVGLAVVLLAVGAGVYAANRGPDCLTLPASTKDVVAKIDPVRNCVVATYAVGQRPGPIVAANGLIWVGDTDDHTISIVNPVAKTIHATGADGSPVDLTAGPGAIYVLTLSGAANTIPFRSNRISESVSLPIPDTPQTYGTAAYVAIAFYSDHVWVTNPGTGDVVRRAGKGGDSLHISDVPSKVGGYGIGPIATTVGTVWIASTDDPTLYRVDANKVQPVSIDPQHGGAIAIATSPSAIWLLRTDGSLTRIDAATGGTTSSPRNDSGSALAASPDAVWVASFVRGRVVRADPENGALLATVPVGGHPSGVAIAPDGSVWVTIQGP